jgi:hypothetical protein
MIIGNLKLYDLFRKDLHLSDDKAMQVVNALDEHYERKSSSKIEQLATKAELQAVKVELKEEQVAIKAELIAVKIQMTQMVTKSELSAVESGLKEVIHNTEGRINTRSTYLTLVQLLTIIAAIITIMRYMK